MQDYIGRHIDRYQVTERLGVGGMAVVYKAYDMRLERDVAIKLIRAEAIPAEQHERLLKRFEREAKAQARFNHRHIVPVHDYGEADGVPYLVMACISGGTLKARTGKPVDWQQALHWLIPVADALSYAHEFGIIHRDIKPSNILFDAKDQPILTDFGIAKLLETDEATLTGTGLGVGTPEYMAPEQWQGQASPATDQYALGVVLYELLTGQKPYTADTPAAVAILQATEPLKAPSKKITGIPSELEKALYKALAKNPADRYETIAEFKDVLAHLLDKASTFSPEQSEAKETSERPMVFRADPIESFEEGMARMKELMRESEQSKEKGPSEHYRSEESLSEEETFDVLDQVSSAASTTHQTWSVEEPSKHKESKIWIRWISAGLVVISLAFVIVAAALGRVPFINVNRKDEPLPDVEFSLHEENNGDPADMEPVNAASTQEGDGTETSLVVAEPELTATSISAGSPIFCMGNGIWDDSICNPNWPLDGHDRSRTSWNAMEQTLTPPLAVDWETKIDEYTADGISVSNRFILLSGMDATSGFKNSVHTLKKMGDPVWSFVLEDGGGAMDHPPAVAGNSVYFGGQGDDVLYALDQNTGELKWTKPGFGSLYASPVNISDEVIFGFGSTQLMALFDNGDKSWSSDVDGWGGRTAIWEDILVALSYYTSPMAINKYSGDVLWQRNDIDIDISDLIAINESVYLGSSGRIMGLDINTGKTLWETRLPAELKGSNTDSYSLAYANGVLVAAGGQWATDDDRTQRMVLLALDAQSGEIIWETQPSASWDGVVIANGYVYVFHAKEHIGEGEVLALELLTGDSVWSWTPDENMWLAHFVVADGGLYLQYSPVDSLETYVVAFRSE